mgnify:CR=1 FL=1
MWGSALRPGGLTGVSPGGESATPLTRSGRGRQLAGPHALEAQLDLLYSYCQYEQGRRFPGQMHISLYRGTNDIDDYEMLASAENDNINLVLNNLSSFTDNRERADEFGDSIIEVKIPRVKLLYFPGLLAGILKSEQEYLVIGGAYQVRLHKY